MTAKVNWPLGNGETLPFEVHWPNEGWRNVPGLYIFAYQRGNNWYALYVGQAESFQSRLPSHERLDEAVRNGATHIHAFNVQQQAQRDSWERRLIQHLQPSMNTQHRNVS